MDIIYDAKGRNDVLIEDAHIDIVTKRMKMLDNEYHTFLHLSSNKPDLLTIRGSEEKRVAIRFVTRTDKNRRVGSSLMDTELMNSTREFEFFYDEDLVDYYKINQTVPMEIAEMVIKYYFEHGAIRNYGQYKWEGNVQTD